MFFLKKKRLRISGNNNEFICPKTERNELLKYGKVKISGNNNQVHIPAPNYLKFSEITINGDNNTVILPPACYGKLNLNINCSHATFIVGEKTGFMGTEIAFRENGSKIIIGNDCMIAKESRIYCSDFHSIIDLSTGRAFNRGVEIIIGNHVWIGEGVKILKNTHIADNVIIGTASIVTKDLLTPYSLYAGNPASLKKSGIDWKAEAYDLIAQEDVSL